MGFTSRAHEEDKLVYFLFNSIKTKTAFVQSLKAHHSPSKNNRDARNLIMSSFVYVTLTPQMTQL